MNFDEKLYIQIHAAVSKVAERRKFDTQITEDITQEVAIRVLKAFKKPGRKEEIQDEMAYIYSIIISTFVDYYREKKRKEFNPNDVDWLNNIAEPYDIILENQAKSFPTIIDDYLRKNPKSFTRQNRELWEIFKLQKYSTQEMMARMGMTNPAAIHTAKARLIERIAAIYRKIAKSDPG